MTDAPPTRSLTSAPPKRELRFVYLLDRSGSMSADGKIQALNEALRQSTRMLADSSKGFIDVEVLVQVAAFSDGAEWVVGEATAPDAVRWSPLTAGGYSDLGSALELLAVALDARSMPTHAMPPVVLLVSDGQPTDDYRAGLAAVARTVWGARAVRLAVAVGQDADQDMLREFLGPHALRGPIQAGSATASIAEALREATAAASRIASGTVSAFASDVEIIEFDELEGLD